MTTRSQRHLRELVGLDSDGQGGGSVSGPPLIVIGPTPPMLMENSAEGVYIGSLFYSGATGTPSWTLTDASNRTKRVGNIIQSGATPADFEAGNSFSIGVSVTGLTPSPPPATFFILVLDDIADNNALITLVALTLSANTINEHSAAGTAVGSLVGLSSGSTPTIAPGQNAGGRFALSGTSIVAGLVETDYDTAPSHQYSITVIETNPMGSNSPNPTVLTINVNEVIVPPPPVALKADFSVPENEPWMFW